MQWISKKWHAWLSQRFNVVDKKVLAQRDVLVFFNKEGYLYLILLIITFMAGINYANNLVLALCFLLTSILVISFYLAFRQLYKLTIDYEMPDLGQVGQLLPIKFNLHPMPAHLHLHLRLEYFGQAKKLAFYLNH